MVSGICSPLPNPIPGRTLTTLSGKYHCTVQYSTVQYSTVQYSTVQYGYSTVQYGYSTVRWYFTIQYFTILNTYCVDYKAYCFAAEHFFSRFYNKVAYSRCAPMYGKCRLLSIYRYNPHMTSLIIEARMTSHEDFIYLC